MGATEEKSNNKKTLKGGEFLIEETKAENIFIPEEFDTDQKMIAETCADFLEKEVMPKIDRIEAHEEGLMEELMDQAGEMGILSVSFPEKYGGYGKDFVTGMLATEKIGPGHSFAVSVAAHNGIGTLPILYFGTDEQKEKYMPKLSSGEWKASYALTEPGAGSDANSGKTKAVPSDDGEHYVINGQKMWITNAGFADVFIVFAKIEDDDNLSAFIVEKDFGGIEVNEEEGKMGITGSSTAEVIFNDCKVPQENLLGERNKGFKIAMYILNIGRIKLAGAVTGGAKATTTDSVQYANERKQFGTNIGSFGAIQHKIAQQAILTYTLESALYRCSQNVQNKIDEEMAEGKDRSEADLTGIREYAVEAAMLKVFGSEALDFIVDEGVQIYGGMGYSSETPVERAYRNSRINRIFEGTNEINRLLVMDMMFKKGMKGELNLLSAAKDVSKELMSIPDLEDNDDEPFAKEKKYIQQFKKTGLMIAGAAAQEFATELEDEQEILMNLADILIQIYTAESVLLRVEKLSNKDEAGDIALQYDMAKTYIYDAADKINKSGRDAINAFAEGDDRRMMLLGLKRFTKTDPVNTKEMRRDIAEELLSANEYCF